MGLTDFTDREYLKLTTLEYRIEEDGHFLSEPIVQLFCRDAQGNRRMIEVEGFYPSFFITEEEYQEHEHDIFNESMVRSVVAKEFVTSAENIENAALTETDLPPRTTLHDDPLVKIETVVPSHVSDLKSMDIFDETWEADVFFTNRFLIDSEVKLGLSVPRGADRIDVSELEVLEEAPDIDPRVATIDIEVWSGGKFPDTQDPTKPITAVTIHDSYTDEYESAVLHPDAVDQGDEHTWSESIETEMKSTSDKCDIRVFHDEAEMLAHFNNWIIEHDPDLMTGWNSSRNEMGSGFDYPYWINRCKRINEWTIDDTSPTDSCFVTNRGAPVMGGREMFDMLQAYKKTQIHEKRSYSLGFIAQDELGYGKEDVADLDDGWLHEPVEFMKYNIRDVEAVVEIESKKSVLEMYDHIRSIAGATYSEIADSNIGIIDMLYLREARDRGIALPTSVRPEVQHYWGAYVFPPLAGRHENVVYPDLSSLYPNLFKDMNASPETIVGNADDLAESEYTEEDCHTVYVDRRSESEKRSADEPERSELFVLRPEVQESFVRDVIGDLIDMKYEYKKDEYADEAYEAVKRITNSVYGCMGDSVSYGVGFRLFDWRIAEAITLAGRDVIKFTADTFEKTVQDYGYDDAQIISGDTDSCVCEIPSADGSWDNSSMSKDDIKPYVKEANLSSVETPMAETLITSIKAADAVDSMYPEFMEERFGIEDGNMAVEIESYADRALLMNKKKRYGQRIRWDEGDLVDEIEVKGFEMVRSDSATITEETQGAVITDILKVDEPKGVVTDHVKDAWELVTSGDIDPTEVGRPSKINNPLWDYGWSQSTVEFDDKIDDVDGNRLETGDQYLKFFTPQPHIRGARYANEHIENEDLSEGSKPMMFYADGVVVSSDLPEVYDYNHKSLNAPTDVAYRDERQIKELEREVDAIAVDDIRNLPDGILIDWEKMAEKTIRDPIEPIVNVMNWDFDDLIAEGNQTGLAEFM